MAKKGKEEGKIIKAIKKPEEKKKRASPKKKPETKKEPEIIEEVKEKLAEQSELEEDVKLVSENFSEFFAGQETKAPVLEKIAESGDINLEQIVFRERKKGEDERGVNYLDTKSDYQSIGGRTSENGSGNSNGMRYSETTVSYETILKNEESQRERLRNISLIRPFERDTQKVSEVERTYQRETGSEKYMTGGDKK